MTNPVIEIVILLALVLFVASRLYAALGKDEHRPDPNKRREPVPNQRSAEIYPMPERERLYEPTFGGPAADVLRRIYEKDNSFDPDQFVKGARAAYEMIVGAFAAGNREQLKTLVDDDVFEAWDAAITERETSGTKPFELLRIRKCQIQDAELNGTLAQIMVEYEAELGDGEDTKSAHEIWIYKRDVTSSDPNWLLDDVEAAS